MVECVAPIVAGTATGLRISDVVEGASETACNVEAARHADHPDGVQAVGILEDLRFERFGRDPARETVRCYRMGDGADTVLVLIQGSKELGSPAGREP